MSTARTRLSLIALSALVPLAALACGGSDGKATTAGAGTTTPAVAPTTTDTSGGTAPASTTAVAYEDAESAFRAGEYGRAAELFSAYTEYRAENPWGHYMLGLAAWKSGDRGRAERAFDKALELDPKHVKSLINSSRVLLEVDRAAEALDRIEAALAIDSTSPDALRLLGRAYHELGQLDEAIEAYRDALIVNENDLWAMNNLGLIYIERGEPATALGPLARAVELKGTAPVFQNNLGIALELTGHVAAAKAAFEAALAADSTYPKAAVNLARVSERDTVATEPVDLHALAQAFKLKVRMWQDTPGRAPLDSTEGVEVEAPVGGDSNAVSDAGVARDTAESEDSSAVVEPEAESQPQQ